ncbi:MAG: alpha/beta hydrolase [Myxococcota bacterium]
MTPLPSPRRIRVSDVHLSVHEAGEGPAVVLCHGFPELAHSWTHPFTAIRDAGFHVIAPDQRGYGGSDVPTSVEDYDLEHLTGDLVGLLDALEIERAVFVGHDWGGLVTWAMPILHPERCLGVVGVNTPYTAMPSTATMRAIFAEPDDFYMLWFQQRDVPEKVIEPRTRQLFDTLMRRASSPEQTNPPGDGRRMNPFLDLDALEPQGEPLLDAAQLDFYVSAFERTGFFGPISWYRNADRNRERVPELGEKALDLPVLQITAAWDAAIPPAAAELTRAKCSDFELHAIDACGHWTQLEQPEELSAALVDWLRRRFGNGSG